MVGHWKVVRIEGESGQKEDKKRSSNSERTPNQWVGYMKNRIGLLLTKETDHDAGVASYAGMTDGDQRERMNG